MNILQDFQFLQTSRVFYSCNSSEDNPSRRRKSVGCGLRAKVEGPCNIAKMRAQGLQTVRSSPIYSFSITSLSRHDHQYKPADSHQNGKCRCIFRYAFNDEANRRRLRMETDVVRRGHFEIMLMGCDISEGI